MKPKITIIGGGVSGLSAAHELAERGFKVTVFEKNPDIAGGKARSIGKPNTGKEGRKDLPGEHGFRFFASFYKHIIDTMSRIPYKDNPRGVADNLVDTKHIYYVQKTAPDFKIPAQFPRSLAELKKFLQMFNHENYNLTKEELDWYFNKIWQLMTSCNERREHEYENMSTWDFLEADSKSTQFQKFFADQSRVLLAADPKKMNAKVGSKILVQLMIGLYSLKKSADRILNGPTNEVWIDPWVSYLKKLGVEFYFNATAQKISLADSRIENVVIEVNRKHYQIDSDYYLFCIPVEAMAEIIDEDILRADQSLQNIKQLSKNVAWMNGIQFFLNSDIKISQGHINLIGTPWALTAISQAQFWDKFDLSKYGDGTVKGILSIDISDWSKHGLLHKKPARHSTPKEIKEEVWFQLKTWLNSEVHEILKDEQIVDWFLDPDIIKDDESPNIYQHRNAEPLLINKPRTSSLFPNSWTNIPNMFLAGDYVKTNTELVTMEAANEAARRAVNAILDQEHLTKPEIRFQYCKTWNLKEPSFLLPYKRRDKKRFEQGLPWDGKMPFSLTNLSTKLKLLLRMN